MSVQQAIELVTSICRHAVVLWQWGIAQWGFYKNCLWHQTLQRVIDKSVAYSKWREVEQLWLCASTVPLIEWSYRRQWLNGICVLDKIVRDSLEIQKAIVVMDAIQEYGFNIIQHQHNIYRIWLYLTPSSSQNEGAQRATHESDDAVDKVGICLN